MRVVTLIKPLALPPSSSPISYKGDVKEPNGTERKNRQTCALELSPLFLVFPPFDFQNGGGPGGGDELVNRSYRDRAADDLGHRDVTRIVIVLYSKIAIYCRKEHFHPKKSRTSRDRPDGTAHTGASLETHN